MNKLSVKDSSLALIFGFALSQILVGVLYIFTAFIFSLLKINFASFEAFFSTCWGYFLCTIFLNLGLFIVALFVKRKKEDKFIEKPKAKKILFYILVGVLAFFMLCPFLTILNRFLPVKEFPYEINLEGYLVSIVSLAILPAVFEEILFRGVIFSGLKNVGKIFSIITSAIMFSVFHMSFSQAIYPILMGLLLGVIMYKENNIIYTIVVHFVSNFLTITLEFFKIPLAFNHWVFYVLASIAFVAFLTFILISVIKGNNSSPKRKMDKNEKFYFIVISSIMFVLWIVLGVASIL